RPESRRAPVLEPADRRERAAGTARAAVGLRLDLAVAHSLHDVTNRVAGLGERLLELAGRFPVRADEAVAAAQLFPVVVVEHAAGTEIVAGERLVDRADGNEA